MHVARSHLQETRR